MMAGRSIIWVTGPLSECQNRQVPNRNEGAGTECQIHPGSLPPACGKKVFWGYNLYNCRAQ